jgi:hypothetical protein
MVMDFRNCKLVCDPLARLARPVSDSNDPYVVPLYKTGIWKALVLPPAPIRPTQICFSDMDGSLFCYQCLLATLDSDLKRLSELLQRALKQFQPVLPPEDLAGG